jgi:hypothetical protein
VGNVPPGPTLQDLDRRYNAAFEDAVQKGTVNRATYVDPNLPQKFVLK